MKGTDKEFLKRLAQGPPQGVWKSFSLDVSTAADIPAPDKCGEIEVTRLTAHEWPHEEFPRTWRVKRHLDLSNSPALERLPGGLEVEVLVLRNCTGLRALPEGLRVSFLDISGCSSLAAWPRDLQVEAGRLTARDCLSLKSLPEKLGPLSSLDIAGCRQIDHIPPGIDIRSWVDIGGTGVTSLPESLHSAGLRWRGVRVDARIAFSPERLSGQDALNEPNAEVRRVMIERMGFERFLSDVHAKVLDEDRDPGGPRQLLEVPLTGDEPLVVVSVRCPSTGRHYIIRVPPGMKTCHQAVAWTAGFDDPADYRPLVET